LPRGGHDKQTLLNPKSLTWESLSATPAPNVSEHKNCTFMDRKAMYSGLNRSKPAIELHQPFRGLISANAWERSANLPQRVDGKVRNRSQPTCNLKVKGPAGKITTTGLQHNRASQSGQSTRPLQLKSWVLNATTSKSKGKRHPNTGNDLRNHPLPPARRHRKKKANTVKPTS